MDLYTVILESGSPIPDCFYFLCQADDAEHAEEQAINAYPDDQVIWINEGENYEMN